MKKRNVNIDYIKFLASFLVIGVHFFLYTGFYELNTGDSFAKISFVLKQIAIICVPLFITVTGYLMNEKNLSNKYFYGLFSTVITYIVLSVVCVFFRKLVLCEDVGIKQLIIGIFTFETIEYSWYVNMYIGLYLLIPFLNIVIDKIKDNKKIFLYLIIMLSIFTSIPKFSNYWYFGYILYPINYYFIGAYLKYYISDIEKLKKYWFIIIFILLLLLELFIASIYGINAPVFNSYNMIFNLIKCIILFSLLSTLELKKNGIVETISKHTLSIYLISFMVDSLVYKYFNSMFLTYKARFLNIYVVLVIFVVSVLCAYTFDYFINLITRRLKKVKHNDILSNPIK